MKRFVVFILCFATVFLSCACGTYSRHSEPKDPINFYYCIQSNDHNKISKLISPEVREALGHKDDPEYLISLYLSGPISYPFSSPFPTGVSLQDITIKDKNADITLSSHIAKLSDFNATLAYACLVLTVGEILDVETVTIRAKDSLINDSPFITLNVNSFAFNADMEQ